MKVGFDFDDTLNTISGTNIAQHRKAKGDTLYIISAPCENSSMPGDIVTGKQIGRAHV